jgi:aminoglycoside/choline kinase family phosphotransferase
MLLTDRGVAMTSEELAIAENTDELPYVNVHHFLSSLGLAVPELYCDASADGMLLLEDIGDTPLWDAAQGLPDAEVRRLFEQAIDQLLILQIDGTARRDEHCRAFRQAFDERLFAWEFEHFIEHGLVERVGTVPDSDLAVLREAFATISRFLGRQPRVLNHRDFHAWNLYVHEGRVRVIDFQDALLAPAPYDLATLFGDRVTPLLIRPSLEQDLLRTYAEEWSARGGTAWDSDELWDVYAACALQKAFKVVGRFHYLDRVKGKPGYLRFIPPTLHQIARLLARRPDLREVRAVLARYFPELRT